PDEIEPDRLAVAQQRLERISVLPCRRARSRCGTCGSPRFRLHNRFRFGSGAPGGCPFSHQRVLAIISLAVSTTFSGVKPNFFCNPLSAPEAPKLPIPTPGAPSPV